MDSNGKNIGTELISHACSGPELADYIRYLDKINILEKFLPEIFALKPFLHNPEFHPEGGPYDHTIEALKCSKSYDYVVNVAILYHDIGKAKTYCAQKINKSGRVRIHTYDGHDFVGAKMFDEIIEKMGFANHGIGENVKFAIAKHMLMHKIEEMRITKVKMIVENEYWPILKDVSYADEMSGGADPVKITDKIKMIEEKVKNLYNNPKRKNHERIL